MSNHALLERILGHPAIGEKLTGRRTPQGDEIVWCMFHNKETSSD
jgi:hypothetical protein